MRTRAEWFELLPADVREKALDNLEKDPERSGTNKSKMTSAFTSMKLCLMGSFLFDKTPQGVKYWLKVSKDPRWKQYEEENK